MSRLPEDESDVTLWPSELVAPKFAFSRHANRNRVVVPLLMYVFRDLSMTGACSEMSEPGMVSVDAFCCPWIQTVTRPLARPIDPLAGASDRELMEYTLALHCEMTCPEYEPKVLKWCDRYEEMRRPESSNLEIARNRVFEMEEGEELNEFRYIVERDLNDQMRNSPKLSLEFRVLWVVGDEAGYAYGPSGKGYKCSASGEIQAVDDYEKCHPRFVCLGCYE